MKTNKKEYVVLEGIQHKNRFFSTNSDNNCYSKDGELWYKEIAFCDTIEEAQEILYGKKEESWDDVFKKHSKYCQDNGDETPLESYLQDHYHSPKRK